MSRDEARETGQLASALETEACSGIIALPSLILAGRVYRPAWAEELKTLGIDPDTADEVILYCLADGRFFAADITVTVRPLSPAEVTR